MSVIVFDVELTGVCDNDLIDNVIVHHESFEKVSFPIAHILNVAADEIGWPKPWIELRSQETGEALVLIQYEKDSRGYWKAISAIGDVPEQNSRVDLYLLDHRPNRSIDAFLECDV